MSFKDDKVKLEAIALDNQGIGVVEIGRRMGIPHQTVSDFLNGTYYKTWWQQYNKESGPYTLTVDELPRHSNSLPESIGEFKGFKERGPEFYTIVTGEHKPNGDHFVIPDTQCKPGVSFEHLTWVGEYIVDRKPDVIVHLGDHADMPSLSSYDKGKKSAEGRRVKEDIDAAIEGMNAILKPLYEYQQDELKYTGEIKYKPRMLITLGNHENRIERHVEANPELHGFLSCANLKYEEMGWEVYDFLKPVVVDGVSYCHYMANPMSGKPYGGMCMNILKNVGESFTVGHKQVLDVATRFLPTSGRQQWGIVAGACYTHQEDYKGHQGNHHWRGVIVKHKVKDGSYNPMFIDLDFLKRKYRST